MKKGYISYFPYINKYKGTCQFCEKEVEARTAVNTKNFDGEWKTTCQSCYAKVQGVSPIIRFECEKPELKTGSSVSGSGHYTLFECAECHETVAYVKSKKTGKYYLANTCDKGYDSWSGVKRVWDFSPHYKDCANNVARHMEAHEKNQELIEIQKEAELWREVVPTLTEEEEKELHLIGPRSEQNEYLKNKKEVATN